MLYNEDNLGGNVKNVFLMLALKVGLFALVAWMARRHLERMYGTADPTELGEMIRTDTLWKNQ